MRVLTEQLKSEYSTSQRVAENRYLEQLMGKDKELAIQFEEMQRRMEHDAIAREKSIEEKVQAKLRQQNDMFQTQQQNRRQEAEEEYTQRLKEEREHIRREFEKERSLLELQRTQQ